jgi:molybdenum cofactor biosynthesis protein B
MSYEQHLQSSKNTAVCCAVITLSDTRTSANDTSGNKITELLTTNSHQVVEYILQPDEPTLLNENLTRLLGRKDIDAIVTNGGTGISGRDQTISVIENVIEIPLPGFGELFRQLSYEQIGSGAMLSRAVGGIGGGKIIFAMPGSTGAVELAMTKLILPELRHLVHELRK